MHSLESVLFAFLLQKTAVINDKVLVYYQIIVMGVRRMRTTETLHMFSAGSDFTWSGSSLSHYPSQGASTAIQTSYVTVAVKSHC